MTERKICTAEFKREAVCLAQRPELGMTRTARDLGISLSALTRWIKADQQEGERAFPGYGRQNLTLEQEEIRRLRREGSGNLTLSRPNLSSSSLNFRPPHQRRAARPGEPWTDSFSN